MRNIHIIYNPVAGNGLGETVFHTVEAELKRRGIDFTGVRSAYAGHAIELAKHAIEDKRECVVAIGGDGTVREVASALFGSDIPLCIIPSGTGNDMVRPLGIPHEPIAALDVALTAPVRKMDALRVNGELCFNIAGFGFDVDVLDYVEIYKKKMQNGQMAYLRGLFAAISRGKLRRTKFTWSEGEAEMDVLLCAVGNGTHFGGGMFITPKADPFDGLMDVCILHDVNILRLLMLMTNLRNGKHIRSTKHVMYFRTTKLTAECEPASRLDIDGEVLPGTPVTFEMLPASIRMIVPERA